jgi:CheY-like chemotaxis protein
MPRILIADDEPAIRRLLQRILSQEQYTVATASNGREALAAIAQETPDLLVLDLMMPVMSGWEVYRQLRSREHARLPIIVLTAGERASRAQQQLPDTIVLAKPFELDDFLATVAHVLDQEPARLPGDIRGQKRAA